MAWLMAQLYDRVMIRTERHLAPWRADLLGQLEGEVLEIGAGTGVNLPFYPPAVRRLVLAEPDRHMRHRLAARVQREDRRAVEILPWTIEQMPAGAPGFDAVVVTLVLCSVPDLHDALRRLAGLLRPDGRLAFLEHVGARAGSVRLWCQARLDPLWGKAAAGCHLTRPTELALAQGGWRLDWITREPMTGVIPLIRDSVRGVARPPTV